ncbi:DUF2798 domain-containing protein [Marinobacter sp. SBS5]|uniref:DUF2798 domain-containing protein n=1 Tax=Marinobacter sp. SBS5 TaxID=3401754 RepID=UPI003AAFF8A0
MSKFNVSRARRGSAFVVAWAVGFPLVIFIAPLAGRRMQQSISSPVRTAPVDG